VNITQLFSGLSAGIICYALGAFTMKKYDVYGCSNGIDGHLFSEGVTRAFGENKIVTTDDEVFLASVQPIKCDPEDANLIKVGTLEA